MKSHSDSFHQISNRQSMYIFKNKKFKQFRNKHELNYMDKQRSIDNNHVNSMLEYQKGYYEKYNEYFFPNPISIGLLNKKYYILDGQHRLKVIQHLDNSVVINISLIETNSTDELNEYLKLINTNKPYVQVSTNHIKNIETFLYSKYKEFSKSSENPRVPHYNSNNIVKLLNNENCMNSLNSDIFIKKMMEFNEYIKNNYTSINITKCHYDLCINKKSNNTFFLGCIPDNKWVHAILMVMDTSNPLTFDTINYSIHPFTNKRQKIPKKLKENLWKKYNDSSLNGQCYVCNACISFTDFECGHVISVHKGGKNEISNLRCVCKTCNNDMGTKNLEHYKTEFDS